MKGQVEFLFAVFFWFLKFKDGVAMVGDLIIIAVLTVVFMLAVQAFDAIVEKFDNSK